MKFFPLQWRHQLLPLVAWGWLALAILTLFPVPLSWLRGGVIGILILTCCSMWSPRLRGWLVPYLLLVIAHYVHVPPLVALAPLPRLGVAIGVWIVVLIPLLSFAAAREHVGRS